MTTPPPTPSRRTSLVTTGGAIGMAACFIGLTIFLLSCAGFGAAMYFALIPLLLSVAGLIVTLVGGMTETLGVEHTSAVAALFINVIAIAGGLMETAAWRGWTIFPH